MVSDPGYTPKTNEPPPAYVDQDRVVSVPDYTLFDYEIIDFEFARPLKPHYRYCYTSQEWLQHHPNLSRWLSLRLRYNLL